MRKVDLEQLLKDSNFVFDYIEGLHHKYHMTSLYKVIHSFSMDWNKNMFSSSSSNYCHCHKLSYQYHHLPNHHFMHNVEEVWYLQDYPKLTLVFHTVHILVPTEHVQFITAFENFCLISFTFSWAVSFTLFIISFSLFFFF